MRIFKHVLAFIGLITITLQLNAQTPVEINKGDSKLIGKYIEYLVDTTNSLSVNEVLSLDYQLMESKVFNLGNIPHTIWMRFTVESAEHELFLELAAPLIEELEVYELKGGNAEEMFVGGFTQPFELRPIKIEHWLFNLDMTKSQSKTIYIRVKTGYPFQIPISVSEKGEYVEYSQKHNLFWGLYMGVMVFAFLYNLFIFISVREKTYFYYILYILGSVTFYLGLEGFGYKFLWPNFPTMNTYVGIVICFTNIVITLFTVEFLRISKAQKVSYYWGRTMIVLFIITGVLYFIIPYGAASGLAQVFSLMVALYYIYAGISALIRKVPTAKFFLLSWILFLIFVIIFILTSNNVLPDNFFTTHGIFIGHMTEVLLLSFALADRINWLKIENEEGQKLVIHQLEENEKIQLRANEELEGKVKERTAEVVEQRNKAVTQRERSDELLLNILPKETAEELKATGKANAKLINNVTVIFTDIKDFTRLTESLSPQELVAEINECFSAFDAIIGKYNIEKIKTIGDSYMAVGGLPTPNNTHASDVVNAAIEIQECMKGIAERKRAENKVPFEIRLGIHTGSVVAGVVGVKKFAYDIWGNTVNIASRVESAGEIRKINISESTYQLVKDEFNCTARGKIKAKNIDPINMYFVEGKK